MSILKEDEEHYVISKMDASSFDVWIGFSTLVTVLSNDTCTVYLYVCSNHCVWTS